MANKAFLVGANTKNLQYSKNDANNMANTLANYGYEITMLEELSRVKVIDAFIDVSEKCKETDTLVLYFSGHGIVKQGKLNVLLADDDKTEMRNTYDINNLLEELGSVKALNKLVILDCCSATVSILDWKPEISDQYLVLTASDRIEKAKEIDELKGSFFTFKICQYLNTDNQNKSEGVLLEDLYRWLEQETKTYNLTSQRQIPLPKLIGTHGPFLLGKNISSATNSRNQITQIIAKARSNYHSSSFAISSLSLNPKPLEAVFVEPVLSEETERKSKLASSSIIEMSSMRIKEKKQEESNKSLSEIVSSGNNVLFTGRKESGKTTLLYYFQTLYLAQNKINDPRIPLFVDFSNLPQGKNRIEKAVLQSALNLGIDSETIYLHLETGSFLILIDNLEFDNKNKKLLNNVTEFSSKYNKNRFIITSNEDLLSELELTEKPFLGVDYDHLYIYSFKRKQIIQLIEKWFNNESDNTEEITKGIIKSLGTLRLPNTPLTISLLLIALEHQSTENYILINKASLIQMILDILLEKMDLSTTNMGEFDFRLKEALLSYVAYHMDQKGNYKLDTNDFLRVVADFFNSIGREIPQNIKSFVETNLIRHGILMEIDGKICFRFGCFAEYFIAQHMIDEKYFYQEVIEGENFLRYHQELDYLTGKQRNNKDIIKTAGEILDNLMQSLPVSNNILNQQEELSNIETEKSPADTSSPEAEDASANFREKLKENRITGQAKDNFLDLVNQPYPLTDEQISDIKRDKLENPKSQFATSLKILGTSLRNCELIKDNQFKHDYLRKCIKAYWHFFLLVTKDIEEKIDNLNENNEKDKEQLDMLEKILKEKYKDEDFNSYSKIKSSIKPVFRNSTLAVISEILLQEGGTPSLKKIIQEELTDDKSNDIYSRLLYTLLYADLRLEGYVNNLEKLISDLSPNSFLWSFLFDKIFYYYSFSQLSSTQAQKIEKILSEMIVNRRETSYKGSRYKASQKSSVINNLHRTRANIIKHQDPTE